MLGSLGSPGPLKKYRGGAEGPTLSLPRSYFWYGSPVLVCPRHSMSDTQEMLRVMAGLE